MKAKSMKKVNDIIRLYPDERGSLIPILQDIQKEYRYLAEDAVNELSALTGIPKNEILSVATFYTQFRLTKPGDHNIHVCMGTACYVRGGDRILDEVRTLLGIGPGGTTVDHKFSMEAIACFGACALAPLVVADGKVYGRMTRKKVRKLINGI